MADHGYCQKGDKCLRFTLHAVSDTGWDRNENGIEKTSYINPISNNLQGIGTGAGYIEISNGTYIIDSLMN